MQGQSKEFNNDLNERPESVGPDVGRIIVPRCDIDQKECVMNRLFQLGQECLIVGNLFSYQLMEIVDIVLECCRIAQRALMLGKIASLPQCQWLVLHVRFLSLSNIE